jgi:acyl-CoA reductase-like NAD-dependent aldehyde dehydrogenase
MNDTANTLDWQAQADALRVDARPWIDGKRASAIADSHFESTNPATGRRVAELPCCGGPDVDAAVRAARSAFSRGVWSEQSPRQRARKLHAFADAIARRANQLALLDSLEMGMPISIAAAYVEHVVEDVRVTAEAVDKLVDAVIPNDPSALLLNIREPHGVVGAITPWNFPAVIAISKIAPAIATGNCIVLKPSEIASLSSLCLGEAAAEAGIPDGVVNIVPGLGGEAGSALALHMDVDFLTFTGSTATGRRLMELAGRSNMKRLALECGGKSPQIVFPDIENLDELAEAVVRSITFNTGQICVAGSRLLVHADIHDEVVDRVVAKASSVRPGNPLDAATTFGPLASRQQFDRVREYFESGKAEGATATLDGSRPKADAGCYWLPTVFTAVRGEMRIAREEIFGPVLSTMKFETEEEAVATANGTIYGLTSTLWTRDMSRVVRLARKIRGGRIEVVSRPGSGRVDATAGAFEPSGQSGFGAEGGLEGLRTFTHLKALLLKS